MASVVNSWNEWDNLREVMVGTLDNKIEDAAPEPATRLKVANSAKYDYTLSYSCENGDMVEAKKCLVNYVELLEKEGIKVTRPKVRDFMKPIQTPTFSHPSESGITCPRDVFTIFGHHVIEAPMSWRSRYFENQCYRELMMNYMRRDPLMHWECAPKPLLTDASYDQSALTLDRHEEIMFDAADMRRFGKDVICQDAHTMNTAGIDWVKRTLTRDGLRVHVMDWEKTAENPVPSFSHLDAKITPIDEDMILWTAAEAPSEKQLNFFRENDWKTIEVPDRMICTSKRDLTARGIHLNMLALSPSTVVVESGETNLIKCLREEGVDCIPIKFAPAYRYGGGLNCFTLDVHRDGNMKSYFPTLDRDSEDNNSPVERKIEAMELEDALPPKRRRVTGTP